MRKSKQMLAKQMLAYGIILLITCSSAVVQPPQAVDTIAEVNARIEGIEKQLQAKEKDVWDKISAASGLVTGILVAIVGGVATYVYRERQRQAEAAKNLREHRVSKVQIVESMIPHLSSPDPRLREAALVGIGILDDGDLLNRITDIFRDAPSAVAQARFAEAADRSLAPAAHTRMTSILDHMISTLPQSQLALLKRLATLDKHQVPAEAVQPDERSDVDALAQLGLLVHDGDYIAFPHILIKEHFAQREP